MLHYLASTQRKLKLRIALWDDLDILTGLKQRHFATTTSLIDHSLGVSQHVFHSSSTNLYVDINTHYITRGKITIQCFVTHLE